MSAHEPGHRRAADVILSAIPPTCGRCEGPGILSARVPHGWTNNTGHYVQGSGIVVLCQRCDISHEKGGALIAWFTVHGEITEQNIAEAAALIDAWACVAKIPPLDETALDREVDAWRSGDL